MNMVKWSTPEERAQAVRALRAWFKSQEIDPPDAVTVMGDCIAESLAEIVGGRGDLLQDGLNAFQLGLVRRALECWATRQ